MPCWQMQKAPINRALVASIHDVSPLTRVRADRILADLREAGCGTASLLVIPDHHHRGPISQDAEFVEWLQQRVAEGHEAVLHGYYHLRGRDAADGFLKKLVTQSYTAGEGEFFDLGRAEAAERLSMGLREFSACGLRPTGFIAPAWLLGAEAGEAVQEAGFEYTTRIATVNDFVGTRVYAARSLVWSVRSAWRRSCSLAWNAWLWSALRAAPLVRMGIHPPDWDHRKIRTQILNLTGAALAGGRAMTYQGWLATRRDST